jgi:hypothetical protein
MCWPNKSAVNAIGTVQEPSAATEDCLHHASMCGFPSQTWSLHNPHTKHRRQLTTGVSRVNGIRAFQRDQFKWQLQLRHACHAELFALVAQPPLALVYC